MSDPITDQAHVDAVETCLNTALGDLGSALQSDALQKLDDAKAKPDRYVEFTVSRRFGGTARQSGRNGNRGWRITTRFVDHYSAENARLLRSAVRRGLEDTRLAVGGRRTTLVRFESEDDVADDDGWFSGLTTWTYAIGTNPT